MLPRLILLRQFVILRSKATKNLASSYHLSSDEIDFSLSAVTQNEIEG